MLDCCGYDQSTNLCRYQQRQNVECFGNQSEKDNHYYKWDRHGFKIRTKAVAFELNTCKLLTTYIKCSFVDVFVYVPVDLVFILLVVML